MTEQPFFFWDWMQHWFVPPLLVVTVIGLVLSLMLRYPADFWVLIVSAFCALAGTTIDVCRAIDAAWYYSFSIDIVFAGFGALAIWLAVAARRRHKQELAESRPDEP